jgi:pyruvate formate lyase activating enzyme
MDRIEKGLIFDIQRYSLHDGRGIRTLVFMKGCPLRCLWCANPESQSVRREIGHTAKNCVHCGVCAAHCKNDAIDPNDFSIDRSRCDRCGACSRVCGVRAKRWIGRETTVSALMEDIEKDRLFYLNSGGGVTVGGGEPLAQADFVEDLLRACKAVHIDTAIETCGFAEWEKLSGILSYTDTVLYDLKHMDSGEHRRLTGVDNALILDNARRTGNRNRTVFRVPLIPGLNDGDDNLRQTFAFARDAKMAVGVEILPYHNLGAKKYEWISLKYALPEMRPCDEKQKRLLRERIAAMAPGIDVKVV